MLQVLVVCYPGYLIWSYHQISPSGSLFLPISRIIFVIVVLIEIKFLLSSILNIMMSGTGSYHLVMADVPLVLSQHTTFFDRFTGKSNIEIIRETVADSPNLSTLLSNSCFDTKAQMIRGYSSNVKSLWGKGFVASGKCRGVS